MINNKIFFCKNNTQNKFLKWEFEAWAPINTKWLLLLRHIQTAVKQKTSVLQIFGLP